MSTITMPEVGYHTLTLTTVYDDTSEKFFANLVELVKRKYLFVELIGLHENILKERKKAFKVKGGYSARKSPFAVLYNMDKNPVKAFYTEANECTVDNIEKTLDSYIICTNSNDNENSSN